MLLRTWSIHNPEDDTSQPGEDGQVRLVRGHHKELWDLIDGNKEFLEACLIDLIIID
jgi:hypothetical protein